MQLGKVEYVMMGGIRDKILVNSNLYDFDYSAEHKRKLKEYWFLNNSGTDSLILY